MTTYNKTHKLTEATKIYNQLIKDMTAGKQTIITVSGNDAGMLAEILKDYLMLELDCPERILATLLKSAEHYESKNQEMADYWANQARSA